MPHVGPNPAGGAQRATEPHRGGEGEEYDWTRSRYAKGATLYGRRHTLASQRRRSQTGGTALGNEQTTCDRDRKFC